MPEMPTITKPEQGGTNNWNNRDGFRAQLPGGRTGGNTSSRTRRLSDTRYATRQITAVADIDIDAPEEIVEEMSLSLSLTQELIIPMRIYQMLSGLIRRK
jgi:hypothetical protein